jgi:serine/threonine protein kinase
MVVHADHPDEALKVLDLGLARLSAKPHIPLEKLQGSSEAHAVGTPEYMCPEHLRGDEVDHRSDIYSLGVILFEMLTGRLPFRDESTMDLLHAHMHRPAPRFHDEGVQHVAPPVEAVVQMCLSKYPIERPQSAYELACRFHLALGRQTDLKPRDFEPVGGQLVSEEGPPTQSDAEKTVATLEAWMPEPIALVKLRGFVEDEGGRVIESQPGLIRVRLHEPPPEPPKKPSKGLFGWLRKTPEPPPGPPPIDPIAIDLHLTKIDPKHPGKLTISVVFRALAGPLPFDPRWHERCDRLLADLRGYLMAQR